MISTSGKSLKHCRLQRKESNFRKKPQKERVHKSLSTLNKTSFDQTLYSELHLVVIVFYFLGVINVHYFSKVWGCYDYVFGKKMLAKAAFIFIINTVKTAIL